MQHPISITRRLSSSTASRSTPPALAGGMRRRLSTRARPHRTFAAGAAAGASRPLLSPLEHIPLYHFLHERHRDLVHRVEKALRDMQANGELERVRQQAMDRMLKDAER